MFGIGRLIVGTSGSPGSLQALRYGETLARAHHATLIPVIAWELPGGDRSYRISGSHELGKACRELACRQLQDALIAVWGEIPGDPLTQPRVERGPAGWVLVNLACRPDDVLVVAAGRRGALGRLAFSDLPGQPGLSDPRRPRRGRLAWYGRVLDEVLTAAGLDRVVLAGNSLGAAVALAAGSPRIAARALVSPAGLIRLTVDPATALASARWLARPAVGNTRRMLGLFTGPGEDPPGTEVEWMTLMAASCRTTLAPPPLPAGLLARRADRPCVVGTGEHDRFLPPRRLAPALRRTMDLDLRILPGMGHLTTPPHLDDVVSLVAEAAGQPGG